MGRSVDHWLALLATVAVAVASCTAPASPVPVATPSPSPAPTATASPAPSPSGTPAPTASPAALPTTGQWTELEVDGPIPAAREAHSWTVDPSGGMAYLFGGRDGGNVFGDLWRFDLRAEAWQRLEPAGPAPAARFGHNAVWLEGRGLVVFAGQAGADFFNDLWLYDPASAAWSKLPAGGAPPIPRYGSCAVLGPDGRLWMSHGFTEDRVRFADTRAYDFGAGAWADVTPPAGNLPVARCLHACFRAADGRFGRLVLYAGQTTGVAALGDLWALRAVGDPGASRWEEVRGPLPPARNLYAFVETGAAFIVFGGGSLDRGYLADTWVFSLADLGAHELATSGGPPRSRSAAALVEDVGGDRLVLFGGRGADGAFADAWSLELR